ncbi:sporulation integral membrane protein YlbJ, partial [Bacillus cereus]|nr:sporulation integral membrane protein YlbJ [Bacillus cereus]
MKISLFFRVYVLANVTVKEGALKTYNNFRGLNIWWEVVFPSLLPFFIIAE